MPFETLISRINIIELLFEKLNIINYRQHTIQVDNTPDFEIFQYSGLDVVPYFFINHGNLEISIIQLFLLILEGMGFSIIRA